MLGTLSTAVILTNVLNVFYSIFKCCKIDVFMLSDDSSLSLLVIAIHILVCLHHENNWYILFRTQPMFTGPHPHILKYLALTCYGYVSIVVLVIKESLLQQQPSSGTCGLKWVTIDWTNSCVPILDVFLDNWLITFFIGGCSSLKDRFAQITQKPFTLTACCIWPCR